MTVLQTNWVPVNSSRQIIFSTHYSSYIDFSGCYWFQVEIIVTVAMRMTI